LNRDLGLRELKKGFPNTTGRPFNFYERMVGAAGIETMTVLEIKEFCGAPWPSKVLKRKERNP
jgi:hypothetical protein